MVNGQDIPIGTWRLHVSYADIHSISITPTKIYAAAPNGVLILDPANDDFSGNITTLTKLDGLSSINITQLAFDQPRSQLLITYADGDIDMVRGNEIININTLKNSPTISGSKRINHISIQDNFAYLSTDFGVVVFDLVQLAVKETWRDIGADGTELEINQSTFYNDSIFLATETGVLAGNLQDNLLDYNNWKRFTAGPFNGEIQSITNFDGSVYAAVNGSGLHQYDGITWQLEPYLQALQYKNISAGETLLVTTGSSLFQVTSAGIVSEIEAAHIFDNPSIAVEDQTGNLWIGDSQSGLVSNIMDPFYSFTANGPTFSEGLRLHYNIRNNVMYAMSGGFNSVLAPLGNEEYVNSFSEGFWNVESDLLDKDITGFRVDNKVYVASNGYGLQVVQESGTILFDETNSPLRSAAAGKNVRVTDIAPSGEGVWVTNAGAMQPLHLIKSDNTWESFSFPAIAASRYPTNIEVDYLGNVWMLLNPANGGGVLVFNKSTGQSVYLTDVTNSGGLPGKFVYSIAMDRDGFVWVGTDKGVAYFPDPSRVFSANVNAIKPVFGNRFLLRDERVTAIEVDGGNRKWIGTENGLWLFNEFGESQLYTFDAANSPLLSGKIVDLEINSRTGELFIMTDAGIASFRSDATQGETVFGKVKIFPNPVTNQFNGQVGISGLVTDAIVKITDVSGKLVWQTKANGGSAAWNVHDYNGRRAATGMYLVFCITQDGTESMVGKIAVVN
jgi:ligand-binding sensor domain-containing protein